MYAYTSGNWLAKQGKEAEFIRQWRDWMEWNRDHADGFQWAKLMRSADDPRRFVSIAQWGSERERADWMSRSQFQPMFDGVKALTDEFMGGGYNEEVAVQSERGAEGTA